MSKPMGAIPAGFEAEDGMLLIGGRRADALVVRPDRRDQENELRAFLKRQLPNFMQPGPIVWRDELPRSPNGKLDRVELKNELMA